MVSHEMNLWRQNILNAPNLESELCPFCGAKATNRHHIAPKGIGGRKDEGPTVCVCGDGNLSGCHEKLHKGRIHMRYVGATDPCWEYAKFKKTTSLSEVISREDLIDWKPARGVDRYGMPMKGRAMLNG